MPLAQFLPGAEPRREEPATTTTSDDDLLGKPACILGGTGYYPVSSLAAALNRTPGTIRTWEATGVIPKGYSKESSSPRGRRRLYTRDQILKLRQLAAECGILDDRRATVKGSEFSQLAFILFDQLSREPAA